jgi:glutamine amidotransferase
VDAQLGSGASRLQGQTDSERYAALIAKYTAETGDIGDGIARAANWLAEHVPMYSLNVVVATAGNLWALRYPDQRALHVAQRIVDPATGGSWSGTSQVARHGVASDVPTPIVLIASERIDDADDWRMLAPGELVHVGPDLAVTSTVAVNHPPTHLHLLHEADPNIDDV